MLDLPTQLEQQGHGLPNATRRSHDRNLFLHVATIIVVSLLFDEQLVHCSERQGDTKERAAEEKREKLAKY